eukprot:scaffold331824_cov29-Attheya_sp.AAC.1
MADDATAAKGKKRGRPIKSPEPLLATRYSKRTKIPAMMPLEDASITTGPVDDLSISTVPSSCDASTMYLQRLYIMKNQDFQRFSTTLDFRRVSDDDLLKLFPLRPGKKTSLLPPASFRINGRKIREFQEYSLQDQEKLIVAENSDENGAEETDAVTMGTSTDATGDMDENCTEETDVFETGTSMDATVDMDENCTEETDVFETGTSMDAAVDMDENGSEETDVFETGTSMDAAVDMDENGSEETDIFETGTSMDATVDMDENGSEETDIFETETQ